MLSCIIPAFNECARIARVLEVATAHPLIDEVIVVDDGSTDDTAAAAAEYETIRLIAKPVNEGKSRAICDGVRAAGGSILLLLDADLVGLTRHDLTRLITPVTSGAADCSISLRGNALLPWRLIGLDYVSGERVLRRDLIEAHLDTIEGLPSFGLEVYVNRLLVSGKSRIRIVPWESVFSPYKSRKHGLWKGVAGEMRMLADIVQTVPVKDSGIQIAAMLRAKV
jgi:glycosyltransferase involved in cell wall biosynthesis